MHIVLAITGTWLAASILCATLWSVAVTSWKRNTPGAQR